MESDSDTVEWISQLAELQVRFAGLDPAAVTVDDLADVGAQLAVLERHLVTGGPAEPDRDGAPSAAPTTVQSLLTVARADLAAALGDGLSSAEQLSRIVDLAVRLVPGTEHASVAALDEGDHLETLAATSALAAAIDEAQRDGVGPAFAVAADHLLVRVDDLGDDDDRWPGFAADAVELGIRSLLVCELPALGPRTATLNLCSGGREAFPATAELIAPVFAARAAIALAHASEVAGLRTAIGSRQIIGQAVGILMERHRVTQNDAFQRLVSASQSRHIKLRDLALRITETGEDPETVRC